MAFPGLIRHLVVPTKGRPALLERCITSYAANAERNRRDLSIAVLDDSPLMASGATSRILLRDRLAAAMGAGELYGDPVPALLDYALLTPGRGAARNVQQLMNVGRWYASADDDTVASMALCGRGAAGGGDAPLALSLRHDPTSRVSFANRREALTQVHPGELDVIAPLETMLAAGAWVAQLGQVGDCGMGRPGYLGLQTREVVRAAVQWTLCRGGHFMAICSAYDGTRDLPPFYPVGRGEDAVFGQLLAARGGLIGHAPYAIVHDPDDERSLVDEPERPSDTWFEDEKFMALIELWPRVRAAAAGLVL